MGSTVVAALVEGDRLWVGHIGDSRAYLWDERAASGERLRCFTRDHTVAQPAVDAGTLTPLAALTDRRRHQLTPALGGATHSPEVAGSFTDPPRGVVLLTSDGVHGVLPDELLDALVERHRARALLEAIRDAVHEASAPATSQWRCSSAGSSPDSAAADGRYHHAYPGGGGLRCASGLLRRQSRALR